jgi:phytoene dehydrogenase-like protein
VIANLPPWNIARLMGEQAPDKLKSLPPRPTGWGAFAVYVGIDSSAIPADLALHHQVITPRVRTDGWGEGSSIFLSLSPMKDWERAPDGFSALTLSTHTGLESWWRLYEMDRAGYETRKQVYLDQMLDAAERAIPNLRAAANLILPGTPITFQRFTRREAGWVGGFSQTSLFGVWGPRIAPAIWMVGDSVFPGQSTAAVALGGLRVADAVLREKRLAATSQKFPKLGIQILTDHYEP